MAAVSPGPLAAAGKLSWAEFNTAEGTDQKGNPSEAWISIRE